MHTNGRTHFTYAHRNTSIYAFEIKIHVAQILFNIFSKKAYVLHMCFANFTEHVVHSLFNTLKYYRGAVREANKRVGMVRKESTNLEKVHIFCNWDSNLKYCISS